ncbi:MAG: hypothetical protein ACQESG_04440 [Nanobdellota archaeon]
MAKKIFPPAGILLVFVISFFLLSECGYNEPKSPEPGLDEVAAAKIVAELERSDEKMVLDRHKIDVDHDGERQINLGVKNLHASACFKPQLQCIGGLSVSCPADFQEWYAAGTTVINADEIKVFPILIRGNQAGTYRLNVQTMKAPDCDSDSWEEYESQVIF